jgi:hypothetical protein
MINRDTIGPIFTIKEKLEIVGLLLGLFACFGILGMVIAFLGRVFLWKN